MKYFPRIGRIDAFNYQSRVITMTFRDFSETIKTNSDGLIKFFITDDGFGTWKMSYDGHVDSYTGDISSIIEKYLFEDHPNWKIITGAIDPVSDFVIITYRIKGTKELIEPYFVLAHRGDKEIHDSFKTQREMLEFVDFLKESHYTVETAIFAPYGFDYLPQYNYLRKLFMKGLTPKEIRNKLIDNEMEVDETLMTYIELKYRDQNKKRKEK